MENYSNNESNCEDEFKENLEVQVPCLSSFGDLEKLVTKMELKFTKNTNDFLLLAIMKTLGPALSQRLIQNSKYWLHLASFLLIVYHWLWQVERLSINKNACCHSIKCPPPQHVASWPPFCLAYRL